MQSKEVSLRALKVFAAILFGLIVAFHIGCALVGKPLFRGNHLGTALEYAHGPINLFRPVIVGFNAGGTPTALEFPVWQAAVGLAFQVTGSTWFGWANVVSLLFFATALWPFYQLARRYVGERAALWSLIFFLAEPLIFINAGEGAADGFCMVTMIWFLFSADRMIRSGKLAWWIPAAFFGALCAVSKMPFFMAAGFCSIFLLLLNGIRAWRPWVLLATAGLFAAVIFAAWTHYTNSLAAQAEFPFRELRLANNPFMKFWYFGTLQFDLSPKTWVEAGWRFIHGTLGALPMAALLVASLFLPGSRFPKLWLAGTALTTLVFTHLILRHWHYYLMCCPAVAMLCGATFERWEPIFAQQIPWKSLRVTLTTIVLLFSTVEGIASLRLTVDFDPYTRQMSKIIQDHTQPGDRLVLFDLGFYSWGADALFLSHRNGLSVYSLHTPPDIPNTLGLVELLNNDTDLRRLKALGYNKLVLMSESPVQFAAQEILPGGYKHQRFVYPSTISPKVDAWPVVYKDENIEIKDIP